MKWGNLTISKKISIGFGIILLLMSIGGIWSYINIYQTIKSTQEISKIHNQITMLSKVESSHLQWANNVIKALAIDEVTDINVETDPEKCEFGKWYYGEKRKELEELAPLVREPLKEIEQYHNMIHESSEEIEEYLQEGSVEGIQKAMSVYKSKTLPNLALFRITLDKVILGFEQLAIDKEKEILAKQAHTRDFAVYGTIIAVFFSIVMTFTLIRNIKRPILDGVNVLTSSVSEISVSTSQLSGSASETAAAVNETTTTMEELKLTVKESSQKANHISKITQKTVEFSETGQYSVNETITGMDKIRIQMEAIAESIVKLSEQSQNIGEIIATVADLAEQSNLLAVNASIEAAKAGEYGKGFTVVAQEIKNLAEQSKRATVQVRNNLNDIQKATSSAVMATEQGNKTVESVVGQSIEAGDSIKEMAESISEVSQAVIQIAASAQQQYIGIEQVTLAMENIQEASNQNVESAKQLESSAQNLNRLWEKLKSMVEDK